jgi:hypothetical protein
LNIHSMFQIYSTYSNQLTWVSLVLKHNHLHIRALVYHRDSMDTSTKLNASPYPPCPQNQSFILARLQVALECSPVVCGGKMRPNCATHHVHRGVKLIDTSFELRENVQVHVHGANLADVPREAGNVICQWPHDFL